jgi:hypothetical protein
MYRILALACAIILTGIASGQSDKPVAPLATFHVEGTIDDPVNAVIPHVEVRFVGDSADKTVVADDKGFIKQTSRQAPTR